MCFVACRPALLFWFQHLGFAGGLNVYQYTRHARGRFITAVDCLAVLQCLLVATSWHWCMLAYAVLIDCAAACLQGSSVLAVICDTCVALQAALLSFHGNPRTTLLYCCADCTSNNGALQNRASPSPAPCNASQHSITTCAGQHICLHAKR